MYKQICDKYNMKGCQKNISYPSWPPIVTNRCDMTNNGEDRKEKQNTEIILRKPVAYTIHIIYISNIQHNTKSVV